MNRLPEIKSLLAEITAAPWVYLGFTDGGAHLVVSEGARNGKAPLVALTEKEHDAELIAKTPDLLTWAVAEIERLRAMKSRRKRE